MKTAPVVPAAIAFGDGPPRAPAFDDLYHPRAGALEQARHVFLGGNGLPARWQRRERFVVVETGFGLGHNFLATRAAWCDDPARCERLWFVSLDKHPPTRDDLARAHRGSPLAALAEELVERWPPLVPSLHTLAFDDGRVVLRLAFGDVADWLPELVAEGDAFFLDGFAPARNPAMWDRRVFKALGRLAAPGATAATWSAAREVRDGLASAGFVVESAPGFGDKREITRARFAPRHAAARPPARAGLAMSAAAGRRDAIVVGAGLAGASTARALADAGCDVLVLDAAPRPPTGPTLIGGLFHGTVHADDGPHARFNRAAALAAAHTLLPLIDAARAPGQAGGLLRLERRLDVAAMQALAQPADYVRPLSAADAAARCGWPLATPAWHYPGGGWIDPLALRHERLSHPGIRWRDGVAVHRLRAVGDRWQALDAADRVLGDADVVVLANAGDLPRLLAASALPLAAPLVRRRGQASVLAAHLLTPPRLPVAGGGYALALPDGRVLCGATASDDDDEPLPREADHRHNLQRLASIAGAALNPQAVDLAEVEGRVGWRVAAADRLPLLGALPLADAAQAGGRLDQPRLVPRHRGLFVHAALGSRGIAWSQIGAEFVAAAVTGAPWPLEASLADAVDPARFLVRAARRAPA